MDSVENSSPIISYQSSFGLLDDNMMNGKLQKKN
jgi:hypothetical protein